MHGRPLDSYGRPIQGNYPPQVPIYDPYGLGGSQKVSYASPQAAYGRQYTSNQFQQPQQPAPAGQQSYY